MIKDTDKNRIDRYVEVSQLVRRWRRGIPLSPLVYTPRELQDRMALGDQFVEEILDRGEVLYARLGRGAH